MTDDAMPTLFDIPEPLLPALPYGGTSGWSGTDTSRGRAIDNDKQGKTNARQQQTLDLLAKYRDIGIIWADLERQFGWHHGIASSVLSVLHKEGIISRLSETRNKCKVYVLPAHVNDRPTEGHRPNVSARLLVEILDEVEKDLTEGRTALALARIKATKEAMT